MPILYHKKFDSGIIFVLTWSYVFNCVIRGVWFMATQNSGKMGTTKRSTDNLIDDAVAQQQDWLERRRSFARAFFKRLNIFAKRNPEEKKVVGKPAVKADKKAEEYDNRSVLREYWFPILCAFIVVFVTIWVLCNHIWGHSYNSNTSVPEPVVRTVRAELKTPMFDIVRIGDNGSIVVAGRWKRDTGVSVFVNKKLVATIMTDKNGEFVYAPTNALKPGNYTISLMDVNSKIKSADKAFIYISEAGAENSVSLLMTKDGSTVLQAPAALRDGDLSVSKIDYLDNGRLVVTGDGLPRLRVSLKLNDEVLGTAHVSDYKHFGLGADVGNLTPGDEYTLSVRMHDGDGNVIATVSHTFTMPQMTGDSDTFYTVRKGDCLWIIARNFMRRGVLFSVIAARNNIKNPDLIFPKQKLNIPVQKNK